MINSQGTSFIPQRPSKGKIKTRQVRKVYVLAYLSYIFFFGAVLAAIGIFFLTISLNLQLDRQKELLAQERDQFNQGEIESIRDLENRITKAQERLDNHVSVLSVLEALEKSAVQSVQYTSFSYKRLNDEAPLVTFVGDTDRFDSVLFQRQVLESNPVLAGSTFTEVAMNSRELENPPYIQKVVTFSFEKDIEKELIGYTPRQISEQQQQGSTGGEQQSSQEEVPQQQSDTPAPSDDAPAENAEQVNTEGT